MTLSLIALFALLTYVLGVLTAGRINAAAAAGAGRIKSTLFVSQVMTFGLSNTVKSYIVVAKWYTAAAAGRVALQVRNGAAEFTAAAADVLNAYAELFACVIFPAIAAAAGRVSNLLNRGAGAVVEFFSSELPETAVYGLSADVTGYSAGEYLLHDNGRWTNVYLTAYARALMGAGANHVIALNQATVTDARGTARVWCVYL